MDIKERIKNITTMESNLDLSKAAVEELSAAFDRYLAVQDSLKSLSDYYSSPQWMEDFCDDEKGLFPADLKRGVLSEDAVYNLLSDNKTLIDAIKNHILSN